MWVQKTIKNRKTLDYFANSKWAFNLSSLRRFTTVQPPELPPFDYPPVPYNGPSADEVFEKRKKYLGPSLFHYYQKPVIFFLLLLIIIM
ncbi:putative alanine--glyoxylate transaminase [Helianthus debilis subsp. tardiflorus]